MRTLVLVYNFDSGLGSGVMHYLRRKISRENRRECPLCALVHGGLSVDRDWRAFAQGLDTPVEALHRDEYQRRYGSVDLEWPAVLLHSALGLEAVLVRAEDFAVITTLDALKQRVAAALADHVAAA